MQDKYPLNIPSWIKNTAGWWAAGLLDDPKELDPVKATKSGDKQFLFGIAYLIKEGIISADAEKEKQNNDKVIPPWIKLAVGYWEKNQTIDKEFVNELEFLLKKDKLT